MNSEAFHQNPKSLDGVPDLCQLNYLQEPNVLHNLLHRYEEGKIYTSTTAKVLIAVNPYEKVPDIDTQETMAKYQQAPINLEGLMTEGSLEPHTFTVANCAYHNMITKKQNQSVIVCGESGSGKTESAKLLMKFLAYTSTVTSVDPDQFMEAQKIGKQVLDANPILETFGNAKTVLNNNSSRFGKFTKMLFEERQLVGAAIETYLLEKSRVTRQDTGERNYHVFYQLCAQAANHPEWELGQGNPKDFNYLNQSGCFTLDGSSQTDAREFEELIEAMDTLNIIKEQQDEVLQLAAGILHLGNIKIASLSNSAEGSKVVNTSALEKAARCLGVAPADLEKRLTTRSITVRANTMIKPLNLEDAVANRDSIAKALYNALFLWIVKRINQESNPDESKCSWIGTLDVFGFEIFEQNSLEQFCINFANERLQSFFNFHVLKAEQDLYRRECLLWTPVDLPENQDVIDLIMNRPNGVFAILDSACVQPKGNDEVFTHNVFQCHPNSNRIQKVIVSPRKGRRGSRAPMAKMNAFTINHYAGQVMYDAKEFLIKNSDTQHPDTVTLFESSQSKITSMILGGAAPKQQRPGNRRTFKFKSTSSVFSGQLENLMTLLAKTTPYFVRCIKPNENKAAKNFVNEYVRPQLRCGGLVEALRIIKCGFPTRCSYERIVAQFGSIMKDFPTMTNLNQRDFTEALISVFSDKNMDRSQYQLGLSMIFFRPGQQAFFQKILALSTSDISAANRCKIHKFMIHKRIVRMRGTIKCWVRAKHFIVFRRIQRAATVMKIIGKTFFRLLRRVRMRINRQYAAAEEARLQSDQQYQNALRAVEEVKLLQQREADLQSMLKREKDAMNSTREEAEASKAQMQTMMSKMQNLTKTVGELERSLQEVNLEKSQVEDRLRIAQMESGDAQKATQEQLEADQARFAQLQQESQEMQSEIETKNGELQSHLDEAKQNIFKLEGEMSEMKTEMTRLQTKHAKTSEEARQLEEEMQQRLSSEKVGAKEREQELDSTLRESKAQMMDLNSRLNMLQAEYEGTQARMAEMERVNKVTSAKAKDQNKQLEADLAATKQRNEEALDELNNKYDKQRAAKSAVDMELVKSQTKSQRVEEEFQRIKSQAEMSQDELQGQLGQKAEELRQLSDAKQRLSKSLDQLTNEKQRSEVANKQAANGLKQQLTASQEQLREAEEHAADTARKLKKEIRDIKEGSMEELASQLTSANNQLSAAKANAAKEEMLRVEAHANELRKKDLLINEMRGEVEEQSDRLEQLVGSMHTKEDESTKKESKLRGQVGDLEDELMVNNEKLNGSVQRASKLEADVVNLQAELEAQREAERNFNESAQAEARKLKIELEEAQSNAADAEQCLQSKISCLEDEVELQIENARQEEERSKQEAKATKQRYEGMLEEAEEAFEAEKAKLAKMANGATAAEVEEWTSKQAVLEHELTKSRASEMELDGELQGAQSQLQVMKRQLASKDNLLLESERRLKSQTDEHAEELKRAVRRNEAKANQMMNESNSNTSELQSVIVALKREVNEARSKEALARNTAASLSSTVESLKKKVAVATMHGKTMAEQGEEKLRSKQRLVDAKYARELSAVQLKLKAATSEVEELEESHQSEMALVNQTHSIMLASTVEAAVAEAIAKLTDSGKEESIEQLKEELAMYGERELALEQQMQALSTEVVNAKRGQHALMGELSATKAEAEVEKQRLLSHNKMVALQFEVDNQGKLVDAENCIAKLTAQVNMLRRRAIRTGSPAPRASPYPSPSPLATIDSNISGIDLLSPMGILKVPSIQTLRKDDGSLEDTLNNSILQMVSPTNKMPIFDFAEKENFTRASN